MEWIQLLEVEALSSLGTSAPPGRAPDPLSTISDPPTPPFSHLGSDMFSLIVGFSFSGSPSLGF